MLLDRLGLTAPVVGHVRGRVPAHELLARAQRSNGWAELVAALTP
ncbi:MAG TPA: hypothetical protein VFS37_06035 [Conexibacter sp.]|nr:hypothetical protein [Conexibacter sp.]